MALTNLERQQRYQQRLKENARMNMKSLFEIARFNVLAASITPGPSDRLSDAYVYAWDDRVYPAFHDTSLADVFDDSFDVPKQELTDLLKYLDDRWLEKEVPSFYQLEQHFDVRMGRGFWTRSRLIHALRYAKLSRRFDDDFFASLLSPIDHPTEATLIVEPYSRPDDI